MPRRTIIAAAVAATVVITLLVVGFLFSGDGQPVAGPTAGPTAPATGATTPAPTALPTSPPPATDPAPPPPTTGPPPPTTAAPPPAAPFPRQLRGQDIEVIPTSRRVVALTFDAGANDQGLASILGTLASQDVPATFFLTGGFAARFPTSVRAIVEDGHRLGNHTDTHPNLPGMPDSAIRTELRQAEAKILASGGTDPRPLFRFPFGARDAHTIAVVNDAGYLPVRWTVDSLGWKGTSGGMSAQGVVDRVVGAAVPGQIVLMHVGSHPDDRSTLDADALPEVIEQLRGLGYDFVTLDTLL